MPSFKQINSSLVCSTRRSPQPYTHTQTCFIVVGREFVQHLTVHGQDALLQDAGVGQSALSFLPLEGLQLLLQGLRQVGLHIVSCSLARGGECERRDTGRVRPQVVRGPQLHAQISHKFRNIKLNSRVKG